MKNGRPSRRIKVGFISKFMDNHPAGRAWGGIMVNLPREQLEITVICLNKDPEEGDRQYNYIKNGVENYMDLRKESFFGMRDRIAEAQFDILVYLEVGMDAITYFLAHARLAPVQCMTWGHSMSSGIKNLDYYITMVNELPDAQSHYTEKLIRFKSSSVFFLPPRKPARNDEDKVMTRETFDFPSGVTVYLCPQSLHKMHPLFDEMILKLLEMDKTGVVVLIDKPGHKHLTPLLRSRLQKTIPSVLDRVKILPTAPTHGRYNLRRHFLELIAMADVMIDSFPIGGGTTSIEAFSTGIPIVTLPGVTLPGI